MIAMIVGKLVFLIVLFGVLRLGLWRDERRSRKEHQEFMAMLAAMPPMNANYQQIVRR